MMSSLQFDMFCLELSILCLEPSILCLGIGEIFSNQVVFSAGAGEFSTSSFKSLLQKDFIASASQPECFPEPSEQPILDAQLRISLSFSFNLGGIHKWDSRPFD